MDMIQNGAAFIVFFVTLFIEYRIAGATGLLNRKDRIMEQAIRDGHVVTAVLEPASVKFHVEDNGKNEERRVWIGRYAYEVNGKTYWKVEGKLDSRPPASLQLYYADNPAKAFTAAEAGQKGNAFRRVVSIVISLLLAAMVYNLFE